MGDDDRYRDDRGHGPGSRDQDRGYGERPPRGDERGGFRDQQAGRDFRGERERGASDLAFGRGTGGDPGRDGFGRDARRQQGGYGRPDEERYGGSGQPRGEGDATGYRGGRGFLERAGDEMASWFGDDDASRRREQDARQGDQGAQHHAGKGPRNYQRSDARILEDVNDRLTEDRQVDATDIEVSVQGREITLNGSVSDRLAKRRAEDIAEAVSGVTHVQNNLRVRQGGASGTSAVTQGAGLDPHSGTGGTTTPDRGIS